MEDIFNQIAKVAGPDGRANNGGARPGSGPKPIEDQEKKVTLSFYVKKKHVEQARKKLQPIVDKINLK